MWQNAPDAYLESRILSAEPVELVKMLYQAAIAAVKDARRHLANRDILARARAITKACTILAELTVSLDHDSGGDLSRGLARLYDYISRRLIEANFSQADQPLEEVLGLLSTLAEGWEGIQSGARPEPRAATPEPRVAAPEPRVAAPEPWTPSPWAQPPSEALPEYSSHAWNF
ncbi:MAG TPA: flagellar export chaperone FliS [Bryobacteraceae bacterium]|nr:flagellar export chaperone FliS [Bryobacteraceae bacterium]